MLDIRQGDAFEWMRSMPAESVDLFLTDPPYQSLEKHRARGTTTRLKKSKGSSNEWFSVIGDDRMPELLREAYRVLRRDRHAYVFCDPDTLFVLRPAAQAAGFEFRRIIVWDKARAGMGYGYRRQTEFVIYLRKGNRQVADLGVPDLLRCPAIRNGYPTEKPVPLLVNWSSIRSWAAARRAWPLSDSGVASRGATSRRAASRSRASGCLGCAATPELRSPDVQPGAPV